MMPNSESKMKSYRVLALSILTLASAGFASVASAQSVTRAEVRADLIRLEQAGYNPSAGEDASYPDKLLAAEAKVAAEDRQASQQTLDSVGGTSVGTSAASTQHTEPASSPAPCVGPVSFCQIYSGS
jgi:hypothetical protein